MEEDKIIYEPVELKEKKAEIEPFLAVELEEKSREAKASTHGVAVAALRGGNASVSRYGMALREGWRSCKRGCRRGGFFSKRWPLFCWRWGCCRCSSLRGCTGRRIWDRLLPKSGPHKPGTGPWSPKLSARRGMGAPRESPLEACPSWRLCGRSENGRYGLVYAGSK